MDDLRERLLDLATEAPAVEGVPPALPGRARLRIARNVVAGLGVIALVLAGSVETLRASGRPEPVPASPSPPPLPPAIVKVQRWFSAAQGKIVVDVGADIQAIDPYGATAPAALDDVGTVQNWSADGRRLLIHDGRHLVVIDSDGGRTTVADTGAVGWGSLSPDGSTVVYQSGRGLMIVAASGGATARVLAEGDRRNGYWMPSWSPDGTQIAYVADGPGGSSWSISVMDADGTDERVIVDLSGHAYSELGWISWSPDGSHLAFATNRCKLCARIYAVRADGSDLQMITHKDSVSPVWSPDGTRIAYISRQGLATMDPDGSDVEVLDIPANSPFITWNPVPTPV